MTSQTQRHIYLVDDDEDDRSFFIDALNEVDPSVIVTQLEDGYQLMEMLYSRPDPLPEVIFLDINMPRKGGFECLEEIKNKQPVPEKLKVIVFSTCNNPDSIEQARLLDASFYAVKPNSFSVLKALINDILLIDWSSPQLKSKKFRLL